MLGHRKRTISAENAEQLAIQALGFIAEDEDRLNAFLTQTGFDPANLRNEAEMPEFLEAVMDYLTSGDELVVPFSEYAKVAPEDVVGAAHALRRHKNFD